MSPAEVRVNVRASKEDKASVEALAKASGLTASKLVRSLAELEPATIKAVADVGGQLGLPLGSAINYLLKDRLAQIQAALEVDGMGLFNVAVLFDETGEIITGKREFFHMVETHRAPLIAQRLRDIAAAGGPHGEQDEAFLERFAPKLKAS